MYLCFNISEDIQHIVSANQTAAELLSVVSHLLAEYYINITFPDMVIVENIIPRNVIINRGAAEVDNHISRDDIFDYHHIREGNIYFIIPNIRTFSFYRLKPTMVRRASTGQ